MSLAQSSKINDLIKLEQLFTKPGDCPISSSFHKIMNRNCMTNCYHDLMCPGTKKCVSGKTHLTLIELLISLKI